MVGTWQSGWNCMLYKYFPPNLTHVTAVYTLWNSHVLNCYITLKCIICKKLAHSKLKFGLFSRVVICHDRLAQNCQNSCSNCAACTQTQALRRWRVSCVSDSTSKATVSRTRCAGAPSCWNTKKLYPENLCVSGNGRISLNKKVVATVCCLHFDTKSERSDCNKSSVK